MSRRTRILSWLVGILVLLGLGYVSLPGLLQTLVKHSLAAQGLRDIQVRFDYPRWHGLRVRGLAFTSVSADQRIQFELPAAEIQYHLMGLLLGRVDRLQVPEASITLQPAARNLSSVHPATTGQDALRPLAALVSGQWLAQLPLREISLQRLHVDWQVDQHTSYVLQATARLLNAQLQIRGHAVLPPLSRSIAFAIHAGPDAKTNVTLSTDDNPQSFMGVTITSVDVEHEPVNIQGELHASLKPLLTLLTPWLKQKNPLTGVAGEFQSRWQANIGASDWQLSGASTLQGLHARWRNVVLPASEVTMQFNANPRRATLHARLSALNKAVVLQGDAEQQFGDGHGHAQIELVPVVFKKNGFVLSQLQATWPYPFDLDGGRVSAAVQVTWNKVLKSDLHVHLDALNGHYDKIVFSGVNGEMALTMAQGIASSKLAHVHVASLDVGFPVQDIDARFALAPRSIASPPLLKIKKASAKLLGGVAQTGPFKLDFARDENTFMVQLEHIDLNEIVSLEQQEGLQGSGFLDGRIPIRLSREGIAVDNGRLDVRKPGGVIRYTPTPRVASLAQSNQSVGMIVQVLRNFRYQVMNVRSDYHTKGDLKMQVHLEGSNPDWQAGKPVHLNLNLQENIPVLLRSLQLGGEITERVREHYQATPP